MEPNAFRQMLRRYANGDCTEQERKLVEDTVLRNPVVGDWEWDSQEQRLMTGIRIKRAIDKRRLGKDKERGRRWFWLGGIAASLLVAFAMFRMLRVEDHHRDIVQISETSTFPYDGIRLELGDGRVVRFDSIDNGLVQEKDGIEIEKREDGKLVYARQKDDSDNPTHGVVAMNTIYVPNGKQFQLTLPDGSVISMNAASELTYPIHFEGKERMVQLKGEAYFDVAKDTSKPFKVMANGTEIIVTGTHFNVSAYPSDETVTTTLVEGGVVVRKDKRKLTLKPGYEALASGTGELTERKANIEQALAWKEGYFVFDNMDAVSVMRSVARWYDVRIEVSANHANKRFGGSFPISASLDELLRDLETVGKIKFERKGKEVIIMP